MARTNLSRAKPGAGIGLVRLGGSAVSGLATAYAGIARLLIGRGEDFADFAAARRAQRLNAAAESQNISGARAPRSRS